MTVEKRWLLLPETEKPENDLIMLKLVIMMFDKTTINHFILNAVPSYAPQVVLL